MDNQIAMRFYKELKSAWCKESSEENEFFKPLLGSMDELLYNYCKLKYLWKYFDKETISPGHERFSNDYGEFEFGLKVSGGDSRDEALYEDEAFFFCLINESDARGMWSEYCNDEQAGVCIGYDFKRPNYRYPDFIATDFTKSEQDFYGKKECDIWPFAFEILQIENEGNHKDPLDDGESLMFFSGPRHVVYTYSKDDKGSNNRPLGARVTNNRPDTKYAFATIGESLREKRSRSDPYQQIHFIKHHTFSEEGEFRILFHFRKTNLNMFKLLSKQGKARAENVVSLPMRNFFSYSNGELGKNPRLIVRCSLPIDGVFRTEKDKENSNCCRYLAIDDRRDRDSDPISERLIVRKYKSLNAKIEWEERSKFIDNVRDEVGKIIHSHPVGPKKPIYIVLGQGDDQEKIYNALNEYLMNLGKRKLFKIWCNGHPPIRQVIVEHRENTKAIVESIKRYCSHVWWLKDVDVIPSAIPYRKSRSESHGESRSKSS
jgi:hypothetical protein